MGGVALGGIAAGAAILLCSHEAANKSGSMRAWRLRFVSVKDAVNRAVQRMRDAYPSTKEQVVEVENDLQPGG